MYICFTFSVVAQETFKVMFYNLLNYPTENTISNREQYLETILEDYLPDLFLVCELNNETGANTIEGITQSSIRSSYTMANYASNTSDDASGNQNNLQNLLYYDSSKFILEAQIIIPTDLRDFNIYKLQLNTIDQVSNPVEIYVVVCHLKASSGTSNAQRRFNMVQELEDFFSLLPSDAYVLLGGDLNLYTASEPAFQELTNNSNNITLVDPANRIGGWSNNTSFLDVFTQSTRTQNNLGGTSGGFDDRFDFILTSQNMLNSTSAIRYVNDSYEAYGNNKQLSCYNSAINDSDCSGPLYSFQIRNALHNFSDHLPVTVLLETDETLLNVEALEVAKKLLLKKNLVESELAITINAVELLNRELVIHNHLGQNVKSISINALDDMVVDISELNNGIYYIAISGLHINPLKFVVAN